jgi:hypothetical protein
MTNIQRLLSTCKADNENIFKQQNGTAAHKTKSYVDTDLLAVFSKENVLESALPFAVTMKELMETKVRI